MKTVSIPNEIFLTKKDSANEAGYELTLNSGFDYPKTQSEFETPLARYGYQLLNFWYGGAWTGSVSNKVYTNGRVENRIDCRSIDGTSNATVNLDMQQNGCGDIRFSHTKTVNGVTTTNQTTLSQLVKLMPNPNPQANGHHYTESGYMFSFKIRGGYRKVTPGDGGSYLVVGFPVNDTTFPSADDALTPYAYVVASGEPYTTNFTDTTKIYHGFIWKIQ